MPKSVDHNNSSEGPSHTQRSDRSIPSVDTITADATNDSKLFEHSFAGKLGSDFSQSTFERHAVILGDGRMSQPMYANQRAMIVQRLQSSYGNQYVRQLVDHIQRKRAEVIETNLLERDAKTDMESGAPGEFIGASGVRKENKTGLPDRLKAGIENLSGLSMDDVKVHYHSSKPAKLQALAYTQGTDIHVGPGQERHLPHEGWHVVQQKQGQVRANAQAGVAINDDTGLEYEADVMGAQSAREGRLGRAGVGPEVGTAEHRNDLVEGLGKKPTTGATNVRNSPIQMVRKDSNELLDLTVAEFDKHRKAEQMDWAKEVDDDDDRKVIWNVIDWGLSGLASIKLFDIIFAYFDEPKNLLYMKYYCQALNGELNGKPTVKLKKLNDLDDIKVQGKTVAKLNQVLGGELVKAVITPKYFYVLSKFQTIFQNFLDYYQEKPQPVLQAPNGKDILSFIQLVGVEKAKISDYRNDLPDIRNYHKFPRASLDKLKGDKGKKNNPLTLVLQSLYDHNGAFIRYTEVNKVIQNTKISVYLIEGPNVEWLRDLGADGFNKLAQDHGMGGKITQVMFAGHGNSTFMGVGGERAKTEQKSTGEYRVVAERPVPLYFGKEDFDIFWTDFFEALFKNMAMQGGFEPKVLLRACLTASNEVNTEKLKAIMKKKNIIDADDPTTVENQDKIRGAIRNYIQEHGSLATVLTGKAGGRAEILGAQASITAEDTGAIKDTGELDIVAVGDPKVAAPKIEYVREGKEPVGALKAVIETWAENPKDCFNNMRERRKDPVSTDAEFIIRLLYETILGNYTNDILKANGFVRTAGVITGVARGGPECRPARLKDDPMVQGHYKAFYPSLFGQLTNKFALLVIYEDWMRHDAAKRADFVELLGDKAFDRDKVKNYLDFTMLDPHVNPILGLRGVSDRGKIILALIGFIEKKRDDCKQFLLTQVNGDQVLNKEVKEELKGYNGDRLRQKLGLPVEAPAPVGGGDPQKNVDVTGEYYVKPMRSTPMKIKTNSSIGSREVKEEPSGSTFLY